MDHCHTSKDVRGVLCRTCNTGLGMFRDNTALLQAAVRYLESRAAA
ncbi:endonuclease domain-containing protein [Micromonospora tarensis]